jgi:hypothetical protein
VKDEAMRIRVCIALLLLLSGCATSMPKASAVRSPRLANLQRAAALPWTDEGRCVVREASQPWPVLVERCFHTLDSEKVRFHDVTGRCTVASTGAAVMGAQFEVHAALPLSRSAAAAAVLEGIAEAARAFWAHATPSGAGGEIARQTQDPTLSLEPPPRGLPALKVSWDISSPEIPHRLGWLNYWSAATAQTLGFPDPARDAELLSRSRRTATGGWVVQLTEAPLDLDNPIHLDALLRAYERFPEIGGRSSP